MENTHLKKVTMNDGLNFIAIDFETATGKRASICEVGICVIRNGEIIETRSWLVQPDKYMTLIATRLVIFANNSVSPKAPTTVQEMMLKCAQGYI